MMALMKNLRSLYYVTIKESPRNPLSAEMYSIRGQVLFLLTDDPRRVLAQRTYVGSTVLCLALVPTDLKAEISTIILVISQRDSTGTKNEQVPIDLHKFHWI